MSSITTMTPMIPVPPIAPMISVTLITPFTPIDSYKYFDLHQSIAWAAGFHTKYQENATLCSMFPTTLVGVGLLNLQP